MKTFFSFGRGRYVLASLAVAGFVVAVAACQPTKTPPPPPPDPCNGGSGACLTLQPTSWFFGSFGEIKTFTVGNDGPDPSTDLVISATNDFTPSGGGSTSCFLGGGSVALSVGETCTIDVSPALATTQGQLRVSSSNSQVGPDGPGVAADLFPPP
jgi:hypothetical protein